MFLNIVDLFKGLSPTEIVLLIIAAVLIIAVLIAMASSLITSKKRRAFARDIATDTAASKAIKTDDVQQTTADKNAPIQKVDEAASPATTFTEETPKPVVTAAATETPKPAVTAAATETVKPAPDKKAQDKPLATVKEKPAKPAAKKVQTNEDTELDSGRDIAEVIEEIQSNERKHGKIVIYKDNLGKFRFQVVAANHEPVGHSRSYGTKAACKSGLWAMLRYSDTDVFDLTLQNNTFKPKIGTASFEIYIDEDKKYRFRLRSKNYKLVLASQGYTTKAAANIGIDSVKRISENYTLQDKS